MSDDKKVFISYRRAVSTGYALAVFQKLTGTGNEFDVFMDTKSLDSGEFPEIIRNQIHARPHFIVILTPGALKGIKRPKDWLRQEIEIAIGADRNIVPVLCDNFTFDDPAIRMPNKLAKLNAFNAVNVPGDYFDEAMVKLRDRFLKQPTTCQVTPTPRSEGAAVNKMIKSANDAAVDIAPYTFKVPITLRTPAAQNRTTATPCLKPPKLEARFIGGLRWSKVAGATHYELQRSSDTNFTKAEAVYTGIQNAHFETPYPIGRTYFRVRAWSGDMPGRWSKTAKGHRTGM